MLKTKKQIESWLDQYKIDNYVINSDLTVDVNGNVDLHNRNLKEIPVQFNKVNGDFYCSKNQLTSLKGCPKEVLGYFYCHNNKLTSLEFSPEIVKGYFYCHHNQLTSLKGCPKKVNGSFNCLYNQLTSLKGLNLKGISGELWVDEDLEEDLIYQFYLLKKKIKELC